MSLLKLAWVLLAFAGPRRPELTPDQRAAFRRALRGRLSPHLLKDIGLDEP